MRHAFTAVSRTIATNSQNLRRAFADNCQDAASNSRLAAQAMFVGCNLTWLVLGRGLRSGVLSPRLVLFAI